MSSPPLTHKEMIEMARGYWRNWDNAEKKGRSERKPNELTKCNICGEEMPRKALAQHIRDNHSELEA